MQYSYAQLFASGATNYTWAPTTGLDDAGSNSPTAIIDKTITYQVTGINDFGIYRKRKCNTKRN
ncbi:MAG: hypothetical protein ABI415_08675 [Flavitalea sp.]